MIGPTLTGRLNFSLQTFPKLMGPSKVPGLIKTIMPYVDVRDCAQAHLEALVREEAKYKRIIVTCQSLELKQLAEILKKRYPEYKV
jgi:nucleoside-diphosphate-sugar epimerase